MHNMIMEDLGEGVRHGLEFQNMGDPIQLPEHNPTTFADFLELHHQIHNSQIHAQLEDDSTEQLWTFQMDN